MSKSGNKQTAKRLRTSYLTTIISISLVLFMLGILGLILLNAKQISNHVKENIGFSIILEKGVKQQEIKHIKDLLDAEPYVKEVVYVDPDIAAEEFQ